MSARLGPTVLLASFLASHAAAADPAAPPGPAKPPATVRFAGLIQVQADGGDRGDSRFPDSEVRFYLRRARASAAAGLPGGFDARVEVELAGSLGSASSLRAQLTDAWVGWSRGASLGVRAGQLKTPFGREQLHSDPRLPSIERALGSDRLTPGRQVGVQLHGDLHGGRLSYAVGAFNGSGTNSSANDDGNLLLAARLSATPWKGSFGDAEASLGAGLNGFATDDERLALSPDFRFDSTPASPARDDLFSGRRVGAGVDVNLRAGRFEVTSEALLVRFEPEAGVPAASFDATSLAALASFELLPDRLQLLARLDRFDPNGEAPGDETTTLTVGGSWFVRGHDLKLQANLLASDVPGLPRQYKGIARIQAAF